MTNVIGINRKNIKSFQYPNVPSLVKPVEKIYINDEFSFSISSMESVTIDDDIDKHEEGKRMEEEEEETEEIVEV